MASKLKKAIAVVKDQTSIGLARVLSSKDSSNVEVVVLKATTHDDVPDDEKHAQDAVRLVSSNKANAAACARAIGKRIGRTHNWVVALKSLMLVLRIFQGGDPIFPHEVQHAMRRGTKILNLSSFHDSSSSPWDFTSFVRTYALYLDERLQCFQTGKLQHRATRPDEPVKDMKPAMLTERISSWQRLLDRAIAVRPTRTAKTNQLVQVALYAILQESFDLYKDISEGLALILDSFFHLQYENSVGAFQTCIKAVKQFEEVSSFFTLCKELGIGRDSEYPSVQTISEELIESMNEFLKDQSSFQSHVKPVVNQITAPVPPLIARTRSSRTESYGAQSEFSFTTDGYSDDASECESHGASLEDLIKNVGAWKSPAICVDHEAYSTFKPEEALGVSYIGSSKSLPVTSSADLSSDDDWSTDDDDADDDEGHQKRAEKRKGKMKAEVSDNWEAVPAETLTSSASLPPMPLSDNSTNTFCAFPEKSSPTAMNNPSTTSTNSKEVVMSDSTVQPETTPELQMPDDHPYNAASSQQSPLAAPTFEASPTLSAQNPEVSAFENDSKAGLSGEEVPSDAVEQQNLLEQQQQSWSQNQNILAKNS